VNQRDGARAWSQRGLDLLMSMLPVRRSASTKTGFGAGQLAA